METDLLSRQWTVNKFAVDCGINGKIQHKTPLCAEFNRQYSKQFNSISSGMEREAPYSMQLSRTRTVTDMTFFRR